MDDPRWLRLVIIGLVLAALAVGYFLLAGGFSVSKSKTARTLETQQINKAQQFPSPIPIVAIPPLSASSSAYARIANRAQESMLTLPRTGFPIGFMIFLSVSAVISGFGLRKFPH